MNGFDEYDEGSLPPDLPTRTQAVELVQQAAQTDPKFRQFLETWFPARPQDHEGVRRSQTTHGTALKLHPEDRQSETLQLHELCQTIFQQSKRQSTGIQHLELMRYRRLLSSSLENYEDYERRRHDTICAFVEDMHREDSLALHDSENLFNSLHFDLQSGNSIDLARAIKYRESILQSMNSIVEREMINLQSHFTSSTACQQDASSEEFEFTMKADILKHMKTISENEDEIARLQADSAESSDATKGKAKEAVYFRLLEILDELVPQKGEKSHLDSDIDHTEIETLRHNELQHILQQTDDSLSDLSNSMHPVDDSRTDSYETLLSGFRELDLNKMSRAKERVTSDPAPLSLRKPTSEILASLREVRALEEKFMHDTLSAQSAELQSAQAVSVDLLTSSFVRRSMESPILADVDLHGIQDLGRLTEAWSRASKERSTSNRHDCDAKIRAVSARLVKISDSLDATTNFLHDRERLQSLNLEAR